MINNQEIIKQNLNKFNSLREYLEKKDHNNNAHSASCNCKSCCQTPADHQDNENHDEGSHFYPIAKEETLISEEQSTNISSIPLNDVLKLHSNPDANHTIYLDFDGFYSSSSNWEYGEPLKLKPYYGNTLTNSNKIEIQRIWQQVAEDFAPFNINVTTEEPDVEDLIKTDGNDQRWGVRVAFTYNKNLVTGKSISRAGGGGTGFYNSFNWDSDEPVLVFNRGEYTGSITASHEVGHSLYVYHDGDSNSNYYPGHGTGDTSWGAIMGAPYKGSNELVTQWSKGEYDDASQTQDDLAQITSTTNGFGYRDDDYGNKKNSAFSLTQASNSFKLFGIIEKNTDVDVYSFSTEQGNVILNIDPSSRVYISDGNGDYTTQYLESRGANLDIGATIYDSNGKFIAESSPEDSLSASFNLNLDAGTYYVQVDGVGTGNPFSSKPTGYTDYGSLGQYMIQGTVAGAGNNNTPVPDNVAITALDHIQSEGAQGQTTSYSFQVNRTGDISGLSSVNYSVMSGVVSGDDFVGRTLPSGVVNFSANQTSKKITIKVKGDALVENDEVFTVQIDSDNPNTTITQSTAQSTIANDDVVNNDPQSQKFYAQGEQRMFGSIYSGSFNSTLADDNNYEVIKEALSGGYSVLKHEWTFNVTDAQSFSVDGYIQKDRDGDQLKFEYSTNNGALWQELGVLTNTNSNDPLLSVNLNQEISGSVIVRALDTDRNKGNRSLSRFAIDQMFFSSQTASANAPSLDNGLISFGTSSKLSTPYFAPDSDIIIRPSNNQFDRDSISRNGSISSSIINY